MHAEGYGLVQMVEALGLDDDMSGPIRQVLEGLSPEAVTGIREAMLAMLETDAPEMPLDCADAQHERVGDRAIAAAVRNQIEDLHLAARQRMRVACSSSLNNRSGSFARRCIASRKRSISTRSVPIPTMFTLGFATARRARRRAR